MGGKQQPSPWLGTIAGLIGAVCGVASLTLSVDTRLREQPRFIIDIRSDFQPAPVSSGKNGIPMPDYRHDPLSGRISIPCDLINTGEKAEVVRFVEAKLFAGAKLISIYEDRSPFPVGGKQVKSLLLPFRYDAPEATSNQGRLTVVIHTTLGTTDIEKHFSLYSIP